VYMYVCVYMCFVRYCVYICVYQGTGKRIWWSLLVEIVKLLQIDVKTWGKRKHVRVGIQWIFTLWMPKIIHYCKAKSEGRASDEHSRFASWACHYGLACGGCQS
jgi:hypothetical protein